MTGKGRVGLLPSAFNPPTNAHLGLAAAAQDALRLDEVVFVLPEVFPHKEFDLVPFEQRLKLVEAAIAGRIGWSAWTSRGGLFVEIAREYQARYGPDVEVFLLCGRDAADRIVNWDYGDGPSFGEQLREFQLIVAARQGQYQPPPALAGRIHPIDLSADQQAISSSAVREAIAAGRPWRDLVPPAVAEIVARQHLYRATEP